MIRNFRIQKSHPLYRSCLTGVEVHILYPSGPRFELIGLGKSTVHLRTGHEFQGGE